MRACTQVCVYTRVIAAGSFFGGEGGRAVAHVVE